MSCKSKGSSFKVTYGSYSASRASGLDTLEMRATSIRPVGIYLPLARFDIPSLCLPSLRLAAVNGDMFP